MDVAKSELEIYKSQYETVKNQLKEAKDNLEKALETRAHRKRYQADLICRAWWERCIRDGFGQNM